LEGRQTTHCQYNKQTWKITDYAFALLLLCLLLMYNKFTA
jgi:hypothetical protein